MTTKPTVLVSGSSGLIGRVVIGALAERYAFRGLDVVEPEPGGVPTLAADIAALEAIRPAFVGVEAVVHLAAASGQGDAWEAVHRNNIVGTYNVFEAARGAGVRRVVLASSNHVVGMWELEGAPARIRAGDYEGVDPERIARIDHRARVRPDGYYGVSKAFAEALGSYYADRFGMEIICLRIGTVTREDDPSANVRMRATWLSHRDCVQLVDRCLSVSHVRFEIVYGVSRNRWRFWDISHAHEVLGYAPQDDAEERVGAGG